MDLIPFHSDHVFLLFLKLYIFCTKMSVLSVLSYIYTYGRKKIKKAWSRKQKKIFYIYKYKPYDISDISAILAYFLYYFAVNACFAVCIYTRGKNKKSMEQKKKKNLFIYINTKNTAKLAFTAKLYIF